MSDGSCGDGVSANRCGDGMRGGRCGDGVSREGVAMK